jgi:hypothetical protein
MIANRSESAARAQVITQETITFMRKLDVKEIHGFNGAKGPGTAQAGCAGQAPSREQRPLMVGGPAALG